MNISSKLLLFILILGLISVISTAGLLYDLNKDIFLSNVQYDHKVIVSRSGSEIDQYIEGYRTALLLIADLVGTLNIDQWTREILLRIAGKQIKNFRDLSLVGTDGQEIIASLPRMELRNFQGDPVIEEALKGNIGYSKVHFDRHNIPTLFMAVPVRKMGIVSGAIWAHLDLKQVWDVLDRIRPDESSRALLLDRNGNVLPQYYPRDGLFRPETGEINLEGRYIGPEPVSWTVKDRPESMVITAQKIPDTGWTLVLLRSLTDIHKFFYKNLLISGCITFSIFLLAYVAAILFVRNFVRPIISLRNGAIAIASGDLSYRVSGESRDEIGELCTAFNKMAADLQHYMRRVVRQVEDDLHKKNLYFLGVTASKVNHQVKNYLNISAFALSNLKMAGIPPEALSTLEIIERQSEMLRLFIQTHLSFARKPAMVVVQCKLCEQIALLAEMFRLRGLACTLDCMKAKGDDVMLECDWSSLSQAVSCILENCLEAQQGEGTADISVREEEETVEIRIRDHGPGLPHDGNTSIFEPFFTTKENGSGLGLALAKNVVEAHHGKISAENAQDGGTCFTILMPKRSFSSETHLFSGEWVS